MRMDLRDKRALVTGASSGIGRSIALALAASGVRLAISGRREGELVALAGEIEGTGAGRPLVLPADLSSRGQARVLGERATEALGQVDLLVNNAGASIKGLLEDVGDGDAARTLFETNYWSPVALVAALAPGMRARGEGAIVNVSSLASIVPMAKNGVYSSTKAALSLATEALRLELQGSGVHVMLVVPGAVETPLLARLRRDVPEAREMVDRGPKGDPDTLAAKIVAGLVRRQPTLVYPGSLAVVRHLPSLASWGSRIAARARSGRTRPPA